MRIADAPRMLVVDDEPLALAALREELTESGYCVESATSGRGALELVDDFAPDVVLTECRLADFDGVAFLEELQRVPEPPIVIVHTAHGTVESAVSAIRAGAAHYLSRPVSTTRLVSTIEEVLRARALGGKNTPSSYRLRELLGLGLGSLLGASPAMRDVYGQVRRLAAAHTTVLITGESGTGKGELARTLHEIGSRPDQPFVTVHCSSLPESVIESELFGHERGSFTGADARRIGRFELASGGTLFLDEVTEITPAVQVKLLRVLQERRFERVGGTESIDVDVRIIAATNRDPAAAVRDRVLREDLFYRLNVAGIEMPPLRDRDGDVLLLAEHFLRRFANGDALRTELSEDAKRYLLAHDWPGNVRELANTVERAQALCRGKLICADLLEQPSSPPVPPVRVPGARLKDIERHAIISTLQAADGSTSAAAEMLGISARTIQHRLKEWGMSRPRGRRRRRAQHADAASQHH